MARVIMHNEVFQDILLLEQVYEQSKIFTKEFKRVKRYLSQQENKDKEIKDLNNDIIELEASQDELKEKLLKQENINIHLEQQNHWLKELQNAVYGSKLYNEAKIHVKRLENILKELNK